MLINDQFKNLRIMEQSRCRTGEKIKGENEIIFILAEIDREPIGDQIKFYNSPFKGTKRKNNAGLTYNGWRWQILVSNGNPQTWAGNRYCKRKRCRGTKNI